MANEIVALESEGDEQGVLFLFPIGTPKQIGGQNVVPTPSANLPPVAALVLTAGEKASLDAGTSAFMTVSFKRNGVTGAALLARVRELYAATQIRQAARYTQRYSVAGNRYDAS